jgi:hypothetical protein
MDDDYAASVPCQQAARRWGLSLSPTYATQCTGLGQGPRHTGGLCPTPIRGDRGSTDAKTLGGSSAMDMIRAAGEGCIASVAQTSPGKCLGRSQEVATAGAFFASPKASSSAGKERVVKGGLALADVKGASPVSSRSLFTSRKSHLSAPPHVRWSGGQVGTRAARPPYHSAWPHRRPSRPRCR